VIAPKKFCIVFFLTLLIDQASKFCALLLHKQSFGTYKVTNFFNLVLYFNPGISFSIFSACSKTLLIAGSLLALALLWSIYLRHSNKSNSLLGLYSLSAITGGAISNILDRIMYGAVVDFLEFHLENWYFPAFNVADIAISTGAGIILYHELLTRKRIYKK